jgi:hypothetical protein
MRLDYHIHKKHHVYGIGGETFEQPGSLTIAVINADDYAEVVIPLDELAEALEFEKNGDL